MQLERRHLLLGSAVLAVVVLLVLVVVMLSPDSADNEGEEQAAPIRYEWISADRLVAPDDFSSLPELQWVPYRPRKEVWGESDVAEHWLDPAEIGLDVLLQEVKADVRALLEEVP